MGSKPCTQCALIKDESDFPLNSRRTALSGRCRACTTAATLASRAKNPESARRSAQKWRAANAAHLQTTAKAYRTANAARIRAKNAQRRARLRNVQVEPVAPQQVFDRDGWICGICRQPIDPAKRWPDKEAASLDHIVPLALNGAHSMANCQAAHLRCNAAKGARI